MLDINSYSKSNKLQDSAFVQLKNPTTGELEVTESGEKIGVELHSMQSKAFKRAIRSTGHFGLTKKEQDHHKKLNEWSAEGATLSEENLDLFDHYEDKVTKRMQRVFALVTKKLHHIKLTKEAADSIGVKVGKPDDKGACAVAFNVENIHKLYIALPDLSAQIGDAIADKQNFINA